MAVEISPPRGMIADGALTGSIAGLILGGWSVRLHADRMWGLESLAASRLVRGMALGVLLGVAASLVLTTLLTMAKHWGPRALRVTGFTLAPLAVAATTAAFLLRPDRGSMRLQVATVVALAVASLLLVSLRRTAAAAAFGPPDRQRPRWPLNLLRIVGIVVAVLAIALWSTEGFRASLRAGRSPSVLLVVIDTLRADRLDGVARGRPLMPLLSRLAGDGTRFDEALTVSPWTLPTFASIFTSRLPFDHGVRWSGSRLAASHPTLAERFRDGGYRTAAFTGGAYVSRVHGLDQGFERFEEHDELHEGGPSSIVAPALRWVKARRDVPFFLLLHTYEPHAPYLHSALADPADRGSLPELLMTPSAVALQRRDLLPSEREQRYVKALYDGDVAHADEVVGGFLETLRQEGILDRCLLVVLSDHGEDLWDRPSSRSPAHGHSLYQELLRVPLFFRLPGTIRSGERRSTPVSLLDVPPTLLDLAGLPPDRAASGRSLAPQLRAGSEPPATSILSESVQYGPDRFSLRNGPWKVIRTPFPDRVHSNVRLDVPPLEVFDLSRDGGERINLAVPPPSAARGMIEALEARARRKLRPEFSKKSVDEPPSEEHLRRLRSLGYVQ